MTRETAKEILELLGEEGKVDNRGYVSGCDIWTAVIERILGMGELIFYDQDKGQMNIDGWPEQMDEELKQVVKFKGFRGEDMELKIRRTYTEPSFRDHDHVEIWRDGELLKCMHIFGEGHVDAY